VTQTPDARRSTCGIIGASHSERGCDFPGAGGE
jgi:hypothetical protein